MLYEENVALCEVHYLKHGWKFEDLGDIHTHAIVDGCSSLKLNNMVFRGTLLD